MNKPFFFTKNQTFSKCNGCDSVD